MTSSKSIIKAFFGTASLQLFGRGLTAITGILFARMLGPEEFGRYSFTMSVIALVTLPAIAGLPQLIIRETARYRVEDCNELLIGMWSWSNRYIIAVCSVSILVTLCLVHLNFWPDSIGTLLVFALVLVPFKALLIKVSSCINGLQKPELAQVPSVIFSPVLILVFIFISYTIGVDLDAKVLTFMQILTHILAFAISAILLFGLAKKLRIKAEPKYSSKEWSSSLIPFTTLAIVGTLNSELATVFLGFLGNQESIAYFKVSLQGILVLSIGLGAVNTVIGPRVAILYRQGKVEETQDVLSQSVRLSVVTSVPFAIILIVFGDSVISILFGEAYLPSAILLKILCVGQIVNVCVGSVGLVLNMTGNEKLTLRAQLITLFLTVVLLAILVPLYGAIGAAIAVSLGLVIWNLIMAFDVYRLTGLKTWIH